MISDKNKNKTKSKKQFVLTEKGSLGILAYGDIGLRAWRNVKRNVLKEKG